MSDATPGGAPRRSPLRPGPLRSELRRGPFRPEFWRSPIRGPWLTSLLGTILVPSVVILAFTGLLDSWTYRASLGANATTPVSRSIPPLFTLPARWPSWSYAINQGVHITLGIVLIPIVLAKLWSVVPRLFRWPRAPTVAMVVERLSILLFVSSTLVEFVTGLLYIEYWYPWGVDFYTIHYYGAWVFFTAFVLHFFVKLPVVRRAYRERGVLAPLRASLADTQPEPVDPDGLVATRPAAPTISRRGLMGIVGGASLSLFVFQVGETLGGPLRQTALLAPRGRVFGHGPNDFQVNQTVAAARIKPHMIDSSWRLSLSVQGGRSLSFSRAQLLALEQHHATLTLTCVEGWSTTQHWSGVPLAALRDMVGASPAAALEVRSLEAEGPFVYVTFSSDQVEASDALLALGVNGADISPDHGYPARIIVPNSPGVHNTKWVASMRFTA